MKLESLRYYMSKALRSNNIFYKFLDKFTSEIAPKKWVFIVGCYNSGTTLLNKVLLSHDKIVGLPDEGAFLTNKIKKPEDYGSPRMIINHKDVLEKQLKGKKEDAISKSIKKHWSFWIKNKNDLDVFLEKSIVNITDIEFFSRNFSPAYFIFIRRNGYAVASGIKKKTEIELKRLGKDNYTIEQCIKQWIYCQNKIEEAKKEVDSYIEITYEDFTENTLDTLNKITNFLEIENFKEENVFKNWKVHEKYQKIKNMNSEIISSLNSETIEEINKIAKNELIKYGYLNEQ